MKKAKKRVMVSNAQRHARRGVPCCDGVEVRMVPRHPGAASGIVGVACAPASQCDDTMHRGEVVDSGGGERRGCRADEGSMRGWVARRPARSSLLRRLLILLDCWVWSLVRANALKGCGAVLLHTEVGARSQECQAYDDRRDDDAD